MLIFDLLLSIAVTTFPLFTLIVKGWMSTLNLFCLLISLFILFKKKSYLINNEITQKWFLLFLFSYFFPLFSVFFSSILRHEWISSDFDSQSRFFITIPIFFVLIKNINIVKRIEYTIPISLWLLLLSLPYMHSYYYKFDHHFVHPFDYPRLTTYFVDPLTLGWISLCFACLSLLSINLFSKDNFFLKILKISAFFIGTYVSLKTESRTGWICFPIIILFFLFLNLPPKFPKFKVLIAFFSIVFLSFTLLPSSSIVKTRVYEAISDFKNYKLNSINTPSSIGERISFIRMGSYFFSLRPIEGWGHKSYESHADDAYLATFASYETRHSPSSGNLFHNELITNSVAYGFMGGLYTLLLFFSPLLLIFKLFLIRGNRKILAYCFTYYIFLIVSSFSTEVFALKFEASLHAFLIMHINLLLLNELNRLGSINKISY